MGITNKLRTLFNLDFRMKLLLVEAFFYLGWARVLIMLPFIRIAPSLGAHMQETPTTVDEVNRTILTNVQNAIYTMGNHTLWDSKCLVRAIAAMYMLSRRSLNSTLYLGTAKDENGKLIAHAWLRSGSHYITGVESKNKFTVLSTFARRNDDELDSTTLPQELRLLLLLMNKQWAGVITTDHQKLLIDIDWDQFLKLARHHRIFPIIYPRLLELMKSEEIMEWFPMTVMESLRQEYQQNTFRMLYLSGEMEVICRTLTEHQICAILLKGPVLAADLYGDLSLRTSCDLDIMIPIDDLVQAEQLLVAQGYKKDDYIRTILGDWKWRHHHITFSHPTKRIKLEIHWRLNPGPSKEPRFSELWERRRVSTLTSYPVYLLGREDLFLFLVSHGARHGWSRLRWLADIDRISGQQVDWIKLRKLLHRYQYQHSGGQALVLAANLFHMQVTEQMSLIMKGNRPRKLAKNALFYIQRMVNLHTIPVPEEVSRYHRRHLFQLMSVQQKLLFILSFLYPYPEDAETLPLPRKLHFLYFPLRPLLWVWRKMRIVTRGTTRS